ncbi:hypothetical protein ACIGXI_23365 [Kitasatospora aureofaciens]|uniref:hypothetical protein n=1 Tax=Kitasatospora aureofaciens TaxID=1894 RepID=UPI0037CAFB64
MADTVDSSSDSHPACGSRTRAPLRVKTVEMAAVLPVRALAVSGMTEVSWL